MEDCKYTDLNPLTPEESKWVKDQIAILYHKYIVEDGIPNPGISVVTSPTEIKIYSYNDLVLKRCRLTVIEGGK